jgi:ABC-type transport system substrate-binding protein
VHCGGSACIERVHADQLSSGDFAVALGRHYAEAGDLEKAVEHYIQAGERARGAYAYAEAIEHYQHVLDLLKEQGAAGLTRAARTAMTLGGLYHTIFDFERSQQTYQDGFALWQCVEGEQRKVILPSAPHALRRHWYSVRCLDLTATNWASDHAVIRQLFSGLVECTPELDIVPDLARSWEILDNGRRYVFHLRPDARWSDGHPVTAHDFEFTWKYQLNPANASLNRELFFDIKSARAYYEGRARPDDVGVHAADDLTLAVELEEAAGYLLQLLSITAMFAIPRHAVEVHGLQWATLANIVTNGPFRLETWQPDGSLALMRDPNYHGRTTGNVSRVELVSFDLSTPSERLKCYESNVCDVCSVASPTINEQAWEPHADEYLKTPAAVTSYIFFNTWLPPFRICQRITWSIL